MNEWFIFSCLVTIKEKLTTAATMLTGDEATSFLLLPEKQFPLLLNLSGDEYHNAKLKLQLWG